MSEVLQPLSKEEKAKLLLLEKFRRDNLIYYFMPGEEMYPNPFQASLLKAWKDESKKVFVGSGANRKGKCVTYNTFIDTPKGKIPIGKLYKAGKPFDVYAWDGEKKVIARASAPFKKDGLHKCYRITMSDGQWVEAADHHRILLSTGDYVSTEDLFYTYSQIPQKSNWEFSLLNQSLNDRNFGQIISSLQDRYPDDFHLYGGQLLVEADIYRFSFPLQGGVQQYNDSCVRKDDQASKYANNLLSKFFHQSSRDVLHHFWDRCVEFLSRISCKISTFFYEVCQLSPRLSIAEGSELQLNSGVDQHQLHVSGSYIPPTGFNRIDSIIPIGSHQEVYDFEVPIYHNYCAGGLIHHNTTIGVVIGYSVMFGEWPWSGEKIPFPHDDPRLVLYVGQGWEAHIQKVVEPELIKWWPKQRGDINKITKKNNQGVRFLWEDPVTRSQLHVASNFQESDTFEGPPWDLIIYDEPPKRENRVAAMRGLTDRAGRELFVMTMLKEAWIQREVIKARLENGNPDPSVFVVDGDIWDNVSRCLVCRGMITKLQRLPTGTFVAICEKCGPQIKYDHRGLTLEGVDQFAKGLKSNEKKARLSGRPSYMDNVVLPNFDRSRNLKPRIEKIPLNWIFDISIDFHPSKPWAVLFMGTDPMGFKYFTHWMSFNGGPNFAGDEIIKYAHDRHMYINSITIDPLSKGDRQAHDEDEAATVFLKLEAKFESYGYTLETASKDKTNGISMLNDLFWTENEMAGLFIFDDLGTVIDQLENWMYNPDTLIAAKKDDEACELAYRLVLKNTQWFDHRQATREREEPPEKEFDPLGRNH
jgi:hypothetical protein